MVPPGETMGAQDGEIVRAEPLPGGGVRPEAGAHHRAAGPQGDARSVSLIVIATHDIPMEFPEAALNAAAKRARGVGPDGRTDLRDMPLITIDGADARDFDDAVFAEPDGRRLSR